jgi:hypothetical protein
MDLFERTSKLGVSTMIFGTLALIFGWLITGSQDPIVQLKLGEIALIFLNLFFYALTKDKAEELEEKMKILADSKHERKSKFVP